MPEALHNWYTITSRWAKLTIRQNHFAPSDELRIEDGKLVFLDEGEGDWALATDIEGDDPPVYGRPDSDTSWDLHTDRLSTFLLAYWMYEATLTAPVRRSTIKGTEDSVARIRSAAHHIISVRWQFPSGEIQFLEAGPALVLIQPNEIGGLHWIVVATYHEEHRPAVDALAESAWSRSTWAQLPGNS